MIHTSSSAEYDPEFKKAIDSYTHDSGIGTLGEKTLHAVLKHYLEPNEENREIKVGHSVVDIFGDNGIIEIQTRSFEKLKKKLPSLLEAAAVTVVLPLPYTKWIAWIDTKTGVASKQRKSPKQGSPYDGLYEIGKLRPYLKDNRLSVLILMIDVEEYRNLDGWGNNGKRGSSRNERFPIGLVSEYHLSSPEDWKYLLLPPSLVIDKNGFTLKEYAEKMKLNIRSAETGLHILRELDIVKHIGKRNREYLYSF